MTFKSVLNLSNEFIFYDFVYKSFLIYIKVSQHLSDKCNQENKKDYKIACERYKKEKEKQRKVNQATIWLWTLQKWKEWKWKTKPCQV